jgi:hypothetical protein
MDKLTELKRLAEAAGQGWWVARPGDASCNHTCRMPEDQGGNAAFIAAANPATVLDLIAQIEHLTAERRS